MYCSYCGSNKHTIKNCPKTWGGSVNRMHLRCGYCGKVGHSIKACPETFSGSAARAWHPYKVEDDLILD